MSIIQCNIFGEEIIDHPHNHPTPTTFKAHEDTQYSTYVSYSPSNLIVVPFVVLDLCTPKFVFTSSKKTYCYD